MERTTLLQAEIVATKEPLFRSRSSLLAMSVNFDVKCAMRDEVGKYYFG
jgi:hypothetical protein